MDWKLNPKTNAYECNFNGYGYTIIKILERSKNKRYDIKGYALYFHNGWRAEPPLGDYINAEGKLSYTCNRPADTLYDYLVFESNDAAIAAAEIHHARNDEPTSHDEVEEND